MQSDDDNRDRNVANDHTKTASNLTNRQLSEMEARAKRWTRWAFGNVMPREAAHGEEHVALDVLELIAEVKRLQPNQRAVKAVLEIVELDLNKTPDGIETPNGSTWWQYARGLNEELRCAKSAIAEELTPAVRLDEYAND
jgi:hypothetical protein